MYCQREDRRKPSPAESWTITYHHYCYDCE
jgi:hypothetical protein